MRVTVIILVALVALVSCSPIDSELRLIRNLRSPQYGLPPYGDKGWSPQNVYEYPRKGEYVCGYKLCQLRPGEFPPGCPMCQYPMAPTLHDLGLDHSSGRKI